MAININPQINDKFYRYKMPELKIKLEGKGNGKVCVLQNLTEVATSLSIPEEFIIKYFSLQLGTKYKNNILNGHNTESNLTKLLYQFITDFILCKSCLIPELSYDYDKKKNILYTNCSACPSMNEINFINKCNQKMITFFKNYIDKNGKIVNTNVQKLQDKLESNFNGFNPYDPFLEI